MSSLLEQVNLTQCPQQTQPYCRGPTAPPHLSSSFPTCSPPSPHSHPLSSLPIVLPSSTSQYNETSPDTTLSPPSNSAALLSPPLATSCSYSPNCPPLSFPNTDNEDVSTSDHGGAVSSNWIDPANTVEQQDNMSTNRRHQVDDDVKPALVDDDVKPALVDDDVKPALVDENEISGGGAETTPQVVCGVAETANSSINSSIKASSALMLGDIPQERVEKKEGREEEEQEGKEKGSNGEETEKGAEIPVVIMSRCSGADEEQEKGRMIDSGNSDDRAVGEILCNTGSIACLSSSRPSGALPVMSVDVEGDSSSTHLALVSRKPSSVVSRMEHSPAPPSRPLQMTHKRSILRQLGSPLDINSCPEWPPIKRNPVVHLHSWQVKSYSYKENGTMAVTSMKTKKNNMATRKTPKRSGTNPPIRGATNNDPPLPAPSVVLQTSRSVSDVCQPPVAESAATSDGDDLNSGGREGGDKGAREEEEMVGTVTGGGESCSETLEPGSWAVDAEVITTLEGGGDENCPPIVAPSSRVVYKGPAWLPLLATVFDGVETKRSTLGRTAGLGLFSTRMFPKNSVVTEFVGWSIDRQDALAMRQKRTASHIVKSFGFREYICGISDVQPFIGGGSFANDGSEDLGGPGNNTKWYDFFDSCQGKHRKFLKATKDIQEGEEVFVCYHKNYWKDVGEEDGRGYLPAKCTRKIKAVEGPSTERLDDATMVAITNGRNNKKSKTIGGPSKKKKRTSVAKEEEKKGKKRRRREEGEPTTEADGNSGVSKSDLESVVVLIEKETLQVKGTDDRSGYPWLDKDGTGMEAVRFSWSDIEGTDEEKVEEEVGKEDNEGNKKAEEEEREEKKA
eukprot:GHVS01007182.1.p1 GENE.GHVS01007182.1~~GHVS01007182.1.p1  ORF type:complete len:848 (+),score=192.53 GHVS01007182.1:485-3028(+)